MRYKRADRSRAKRRKGRSSNALCCSISSTILSGEERNKRVMERLGEEERERRTAEVREECCNAFCCSISSTLLSGERRGMGE